MRLNWSNVIAQSGGLINAYNSEGIRPTLRQVYYRLVAGNVIPNTAGAYKQLSRHLVEVRQRGLVPWDGLADRSRYTRYYHPLGPKDPEEAIREALEQAEYGLGTDPWAAMKRHVEIWLEKDALAQLIDEVTGKFYVKLAVNRGYASWTFLWEGARDLRQLNDGDDVILLYLGDHDPSGLDIQRFLNDALQHFGIDVKFERVALTYDQVLDFHLPPNPTKKADSRAKSYAERYGDRCWELDALEPKELQRIVRDAIVRNIDLEIWNEVMEANEEARRKVREKAESILEKLKGKGD